MIGFIVQIECLKLTIYHRIEGNNWMTDLI